MRPIDNAGVSLGHDRKAIPVHSLHDPELPERLLAIELLRHDARGETLQLRLVPRTRQARMPDVVVEAEMIIVDPHWRVFKGHARESLAIARRSMELRSRVRPNPLDVDAALQRAQRTRIEHQHRAHVGVGRSAILCERKGRCLAEPVVPGAHPLLCSFGCSRCKPRLAGPVFAGGPACLAGPGARAVARLPLFVRLSPHCARRSAALAGRRDFVGALRVPRVTFAVPARAAFVYMGDVPRRSRRLSGRVELDHAGERGCNSHSAHCLFSFAACRPV